MSRIMSSFLSGFARGAVDATPSSVGRNLTNIVSAEPNSGPVASLDWEGAARAWKLAHGEIFLPDLYKNLGTHCQQVAKTRPVAGLKSIAEKAQKVVDYTAGLATSKGAKTLASRTASAIGAVKSGIGKLFGASPTPAPNAVLPGHANANARCIECGRPHRTESTPDPLRTHLVESGFASGAPAVNARTRSITQADARTVAEGTRYVKSFPHALGNSMRHPAKPGTRGKRKGRRSERKTLRRQRK